jgi:hypothetical protein
MVCRRSLSGRWIAAANSSYRDRRFAVRAQDAFAARTDILGTNSWLPRRRLRIIAVRRLRHDRQEQTDVDDLGPTYGV